nr:hypothetical protein [Tanacetum cinerariifolium]
CAAPWERYEVKDEMRGTVTHGASIKAKGTDDGDVSLMMQVIDKGEREQAIIFLLTGAKAACDKKTCDVSVRFEQGEVIEESMAFSPDHSTVIPTKPSAFAGAVGLSSVVFIEMPVAGRSPVQFKFEVEGAPFPRVRSPSFKFAGVALGDGAANIASDFKPDPTPTSLDCWDAKDVSGVIPETSLKSVRMCFFKDMLSTIYIDTAGKKDFDSVSKFMDAQFGKSDSGGFFQTWPSSTGKVLDMRTSEATFFPRGKVKGSGLFIVSDGSIDYLVPKKQIDSRDAEQKAADTRKALEALEDAGLSIKPAMDKAGASLESVGKSATKAKKSIHEERDEIEQLLGSIDPLARKLNDLEKQEVALNKARKSGKIELDTYTEYSNKIAATRAELARFNDSMGKTGISAKQTAAALRGVPAQFTDIATSLQGGQAPLTVFLQQGGQLKDMFGGASPAAKALGGY